MRLTDQQRRDLQDLIAQFEGHGRLEGRSRQQSASLVRFYRSQLHHDDDARERDVKKGRHKTGQGPI
jgi:hypothetical protein